MKLDTLSVSFRRAAALALALGALGFPTVSRAVEATTNETGVRLLETELRPTKVTLLKAKCDQLVIAVTKTTLAHPTDALSILHAALTRGVKKLHPEDIVTLPCTCARRIFLASVAAAPKRASEFLDLATALYPDCTPEFAAALAAYGQGEGRNGTNSPGGTNSPDGTNMNSPSGDSMVDTLNPDAPGGFGVGFGPGFPGAPGFSGSAPSGGIALPPGPLTAVLNG